MKRISILAVFSLLSSYAFSHKLQIQVQDVMDLATYEPVDIMNVDIQNSCSEFSYQIDEWSHFFPHSGYHIDINGYVQKIEEDLFYVHIQKDLYYGEEKVDSLLTESSFLITKNGPFLELEEGAYWAPELNLVARQRTTLKLIP